MLARFVRLRARSLYPDWEETRVRPQVDFALVKVLLESANRGQSKLTACRLIWPIMMPARSLS